MMRKNAVATVWLAGAVIAAVVYLAGSDWLLSGLAGLADAAAMLLDTLLRQLTALTDGLLRALTAGLFVTFVGLSLLAIRAGHRGRLALALVSLGFFWLVGTGPVSRQDWALAFMLAAAGALVMTQRLLRPGRVSVSMRPD